MRFKIHLRFVAVLSSYRGSEPRGLNKSKAERGGPINWMGKESEQSICEVDLSHSLADLIRP